MIRGDLDRGRVGRWFARGALAGAGALVAVGGSIGAASASASDSPSAAPAASEVSDALVSSDGIRFSTELDRPLFDSTLVPGGTSSASLWVKNDASEPVSMSLRLRDSTSSSPEYREGVTLAVTDRSARVTSRSTLADLRDCQTVIRPLAIDSGEIKRFDLTYSLADVGAAEVQMESGNLELLVSLGDTSIGAGAAVACEVDRLAGDPVAAAGTGGEPRSALERGEAVIPTGLAGAALAAGAAVAFVRARRAGASDPDRREAS